MRKVLVTGGLGFIGKHLTRALSDAGVEVVVLDSLSRQIHGDASRAARVSDNSDDVTVLVGDVRSRHRVREALKNVDSVVHLAAETGTGQSMYQVARYNDVNAQGFATILDEVVNRSNGVKRIVLASSRAIYGEGAYHCDCDGIVYPNPRSDVRLRQRDWNVYCPHCNVPVKRVATSETAPAKPASVYAATKLAQEHLLYTVCPAIGIAGTALRFQNVYGRGQSLNNPYTGILSIFSTRIRRGVDIPIFEDGMESRDFIHVSDVVAAIVLSLNVDSACCRTYNVGSGVPTSVLDVSRLLVSALGGNVQSIVSGQFRLGDIRHCFADISSISRELGFTPRVSLDAGLREFAEWVLEQPLPDDRLECANRALRKRGLLG